MLGRYAWEDNLMLTIHKPHLFFNMLYQLWKTFFIFVLAGQPVYI